jgi:hypothetical protein
MMRAPGPLSRTTPMPPRPGGVAMATMVSEGENTPFGIYNSKLGSWEFVLELVRILNS